MDEPSNTCEPIKVDATILKWMTKLQESYDAYKRELIAEILQSLRDSEDSNEKYKD